MFAYWQDRQRQKKAAGGLYSAVIAQALQPRFYGRWQVPDSFDGRYEMLMLHSWLIWSRLKDENRSGARMAQVFFDVLFVQIERALRERGVGDLSVPRYVKAMMRGFKGRALAYESAVCAPDRPDMILEALKRNVFGTAPPPRAAVLEDLAAYIAQCRAHLQGQDWQALAQGLVDFPQTAGDEDGKKEEDIRSADSRMAA